jgi:hypothetical protein
LIFGHGRFSATMHTGLRHDILEAQNAKHAFVTPIIAQTLYGTLVATLHGRTLPTEML